jgi:hypothetical protein
MFTVFILRVALSEQCTALHENFVEENHFVIYAGINLLLVLSGLCTYRDTKVESNKTPLLLAKNQSQK